MKTFGDNSPRPMDSEGSDKGTIVAMNGPGTFSINVSQKDSVTTPYGKSFSEDCKLESSATADYASQGEADGTVNSGDKKTCIVTMIFPNF